MSHTKAELQKVLFSSTIYLPGTLLMKKLEIQETKTA